MRRVLAIWALGLLTLVAAWQLVPARGQVMLMTGAGLGANSGFTGSCSQSTNFIARATTITVAADRARYDALICGLVTDGVFAKLDALYVLAAPDSTSSLLNLVSISFPLVSNNSPTFAANTGYTGNSSNSFLDTQFTPSTAGGNCLLSACSASAYILSSRTITQNWAGIGGCDTSCTHATQLFSRVGGSSVAGVDDNGSSLGGSTGNAQGSYVLSRVAAAGAGAVNMYRNGALFNSAVAASISLVSVRIYILARNNGGSVDSATGDQVAFAHVGGALTAGDATNLMCRTNTFATTLGTPINVYANSGCP